MSEYYLTSESVTEGHPDKLCDQISDAILDAYLSSDPNSHVAVETLATKDLIVVAGEINSNTQIAIEPIVRKYIPEGKLIIAIKPQSEDISRGVNSGGAGDQGMSFGYATNQTPQFLPIPLVLAHKLASTLSSARKSNLISNLKPDGKTQVTVAYNNGAPKYISTIVLSTQHSGQLNNDEIVKHIIEPSCVEWINGETEFIINPSGEFLIGGLEADTGLTGRKTAVDSYGSLARHGGGCFSGKDPSKVDRSGAYMARYLAKNLTSSGYAAECEVQLAYAIGISKPVSLYINTFGASDDRALEKAIWENFDLTLNGIIKHLNLLQPIYANSCTYGHFGKKGLPWEDFAPSLFERLV